MSKKIVAVVVTYNRLVLLKECISALLNSKCNTDILVIINNSKDGTKEYLDGLTSIYKNSLFVYNLPKNLGDAGEYNYGICEGMKYNYDRIWIMDDDCIVNNDSLSVLVSIDDRLQGNFGFLSSKVLWTDGSICKKNIPRKKIAWRIRDFDSEIVDIDYASFVSLYVKRNDVL